MTRTILLTAFILFTIAGKAQVSSELDTMSRSETRTFLLEQESSDLARSYARKHRNTRNVGNGFLIGSGAVALAGVIFHFADSYEENSLGEVGHALVLAGFAWGTGITLVTAGVLHLMSMEHLRKARNIYLTTLSTGRSTSLGLGVTIGF